MSESCSPNHIFFLEHAGELRINILRRRKRVDHPNTKTVFWGLGRGPEPTQPTKPTNIPTEQTPRPELHKAINSVARRGDVKSLEPQHSPKSLDLL